MKKIIDWLDAFIGKHHNCKKNLKLFSITNRIDEFGVKTVTDVEYECYICNKKFNRWQKPI